MANKNLDNAKRQKKDEFYTQLTDIEREMNNYKQHFRGKTILCNCDDPRVSKFFYYFYASFHTLRLKRLIANVQAYGLHRSLRRRKAAYRKLLPLLHGLARGLTRLLSRLTTRKDDSSATGVRLVQAGLPACLPCILFFWN